MTRESVIMGDKRVIIQIVKIRRFDPNGGERYNRKYNMEDESRERNYGGQKRDHPHNENYRRFDPNAGDH